MFWARLMECCPFIERLSWHDVRLWAALDASEGGDPNTISERDNAIIRQGADEYWDKQGGYYSS